MQSKGLLQEDQLYFCTLLMTNLTRHLVLNIIYRRCKLNCFRIKIDILSPYNLQLLNPNGEENSCYAMSYYKFSISSLVACCQAHRTQRSRNKMSHMTTEQPATEQAAFSRKLSLLNNNNASMGVRRKCFGKFSNCKVRLDQDSMILFYMSSG